MCGPGPEIVDGSVEQKQVMGLMNNKKPDALLILALVFGLGVLFSAISHGSSDNAAAVAQTTMAGIVQPEVRQ